MAHIKRGLTLKVKGQTQMSQTGVDIIILHKDLPFLPLIGHIKSSLGINTSIIVIIFMYSRSI